MVQRDQTVAAWISGASVTNIGKLYSVGQEGRFWKIMMSEAKQVVTSGASATLTERTGCFFNNTAKITTELNKGELR